MVEDNFLTETLNKFAENFAKAQENALDKLIEQVQKDTGFSRKCAIKYINTYMDIDYELLNEDNGIYCIGLNVTFKPVDELLKDEFEEDVDCLKEVFKEMAGIE